MNRRDKTEFAPILIRKVPSAPAPSAYKGQPKEPTQIRLDVPGQSYLFFTRGSASGDPVEQAERIAKLSQLPGQAVLKMWEVDRMLRTTWDAIADDVLQLAGECTNEVVIEMCVDADRLFDYGGNDELAREFYACSYDHMERLAKETFPEGLYS